MSSHEAAATFHVNVKLVLVRVVVRDAQGHAVGNLEKQDFQLFDDRKPQVITQFSVEKPGEQVAKARASSESNPSESAATNGKIPEIPERYIAYVFDDVHLKMGDLMQARQAAEKHLASLQPTDRAAILTTSGQGNLDFTDDRNSLKAALGRLVPRSLNGGEINPCPDVSYYMADLIANQRDPQALGVATQDALDCAFNSDTRLLSAAQQMAQATAQSELQIGDHESQLALSVLKDAVRRMALMPGQRSLVLVSPGFLTPRLEIEYTDLIDRALRSQVIISALDARGLYTIVPGGDISKRTKPNIMVQAQQTLYQSASASAEADILAVLADATGGVFFHNNNDLVEGFRRVASTPEYYYELGFSPQNLKLDGRFHSLKVAVKNPEKLTVQARRGYYAPKHATDPEEEAKQEIEDAVFSQEELHDLPVQLHTQFFKASDDAAKLTVLAHVDVAQLRFRKADGRNNDNLTVVSALFNRNGDFVKGSEEVLKMRLKDDTLDRKLRSGITLKSSFDVKPGSYLVRLVVRDTEGRLMAAENGAVEIP